MVEKNFQSMFSKWVLDNLPKKSTTWELKLEKGTAMPFDRVYAHQVKGLNDSKYEGLYHKISDSPIFPGSKIRFTKPKPCDCVFLKDADAFVVLLFYRPRQEKEMIFIDVDAWKNEKFNSMRKSITEKRAKEISSKVIVLENKYK